MAGWKPKHNACFERSWTRICLKLQVHHTISLLVDRSLVQTKYPRSSSRGLALALPHSACFGTLIRCSQQQLRLNSRSTHATN